MLVTPSIYFPGASDINTEEVFIGISTELACGLGLALTYYEDVDAIDGGYLEFEAAKSFELSECMWLMSRQVQLGATTTTVRLRQRVMESIEWF